MMVETMVTIAADHPAFAGHFPGLPIVPGVVLLDHALHAISAAGSPASGACRITSAKFLHPVGPGARLVIRHQTLDNASIRFEILVGSEKAVTGSIAFEPGSAG